jgi:multicomponent Na+:H+ antiporter subunit D
MVNLLGFEIPLLIFVALPVVTAFLLIAVERLVSVSKTKKIISHSIAVLSSILDLVLAVVFSIDLLNSTSTVISETVLLDLQADLTSLFFILIFTIVHAAVCIYSIGYMHEHNDLAHFYAIIFAVVAGLNLIVMVKDYFTLFVAWEGMVLCAYAMVGFYRSKESSEAGFKYLMMSSTGSLIYLFGVALLYGIAGTLTFDGLAALNPLPESFILYIAVLCMIFGFGVTAAIFFLNTWLPDAHPAAPPPAHAMLSGIIVIGGTYGILRTIFTVLPVTMADIGGSFQGSGWSNLLIVIGILTSLQGNIYTLIQFMRKDAQARNLKRIFAFSTISHMGYLIIGLGAGNVLGIGGTLFHALNHAAAKGVLFMITGYLIYSTGSYYLDHYKGLGRRDPIIGICFTIGLFSLASIPLTGGFWSKLMIILGVFNNSNPIFGVTAGLVILFVTFFAAAGYLWLIWYLVMMKPDQDEKYIKGFDAMTMRNGGFMKLAIVSLTIFVLFLGFFPTAIADFAVMAANALFP